MSASSATNMASGAAASAVSPMSTAGGGGGAAGASWPADGSTPGPVTPGTRRGIEAGAMVSSPKVRRPEARLVPIPPAEPGRRTMSNEDLTAAFGAVSMKYDAIESYVTQLAGIVSSNADVTEMEQRNLENSVHEVGRVKIIIEEHSVRNQAAVGLAMSRMQQEYRDAIDQSVQGILGTRGDVRSDLARVDQGVARHGSEIADIQAVIAAFAEKTHVESSSGTLRLANAEQRIEELLQEAEGLHKIGNSLQNGMGRINLAFDQLQRQVTEMQPYVTQTKANDPLQAADPWSRQRQQQQAPPVTVQAVPVQQPQPAPASSNPWGSYGYESSTNVAGACAGGVQSQAASNQWLGQGAQGQQAYPQATQWDPQQGYQAAGGQQYGYGGGQAGYWRGDFKFFDDKIAQHDSFQLKDNNAHKWVQAVRNYLVGKCRDMRPLLAWAEDQQHRSIAVEELQGLQARLMVDPDLVNFNQQLLSVLSLNLQSNASASTRLQNVEVLHGVEVWRRIVVPIRSRSLETRHRLHDLVRNPKQATRLGGIMDAIEDWELEIQKYVMAGGRDLDEEEKRLMILNMLPRGLPYTFVTPLRKIESYAELKEALREESEFYKELGPRSGAGGALAVHREEAEGSDRDDEDEQELLAMMDGMDKDEILAFMRKKGTGKQRF